MVLNLEAGGLERLVADMVRAADPDRFDMHILALQFLGREAQGLEGRAILHRAAESSRLEMLRPSRLARQIREIAPGVVHSHSGVWHKASLAARMAGVPKVIHTDHGRPRLKEPLLDRLLDRLAARRTDHVVAVSSSVARILVEMGVDGSRIRVVTNGIDTDRFSPRTRGGLRGELGWPEDTLVVGSLGRLDPIKGYDVLVKAFRRLCDQAPSPERLRLLIVGEGDERSRLDALIEASGLRGSAAIVGWREDPERVLPELDVFCLSSHSEGTSVSLLEAMSCGVCPIVTDVGGNRDVLGTDLADRLVPPDDPDALARALLMALLDEQARADAGARGRRRVGEHYSLRRMVGDYVQLYAGEAGATRAS